MDIVRKVVSSEEHVVVEVRGGVLLGRAVTSGDIFDLLVHLEA